MYYDEIDFYAINKGESDTKIEIHSVINRWKNETNGQKKKIRLKISPKFLLKLQ